ncbi:MAG: 50S ribosomal protein L1 [bacterium]
MRSKTYQAIKQKVPAEPVDISTAVAFLKENARSSFDETIEVHILLGINPSKSDQMVRGTVRLPAGAVKQQSIVVFTDNAELQKEMAQSGAVSGGQELIDQIVKDGSLDADITIATPDMMPRIAKAAKILGPKGLMPNPKTGTVTPNPASVVKALQSGQVSFKMDQQGNIHAAVGKISWEQDKIIANAREFIKAVTGARPAAAKGEFIRTISLTSTMSPAIRLTA